ncbi:protein split ends isoform X2 [Chelonus insularis]|uniref:protein split ends isoform X2 n=1 Tax=Chelonus insularis TaxID=460826 RepID=UPI00158D2A8E|nr:protein split ends-like isoform X2 [Chelonus insularis]
MDNLQLIIRITRYGRVQSVKLLPRGEECPVDGGSGGSLGEGSEGGSGTGSGSGSAGGGSTSSGGASATVAFMDIKSAAKAHATEHTLDERALTTQYYEPQHLQHRFPTHGSSEDHGSSVNSSAGSGVSGSVSVGVSERGVERVSETFESRVSHGSFYAGDRSNRVEHSVDSSTVDPVGYIPRGRPTPTSGYHVTSTRARDRLYPRTSSYAAGPPPPSHLDRHRGGIPLSSWIGYESGSSRYGSGPPPPSPAATDSYQEEPVGAPSIRPSWDIPSRSAFLSGGGVNSGSVGGNSGSGGNSGTLRQHKKQRRKSRSGSSSPSGSSCSGSSSSSRSNSSAGSSSGDSSSPSSSPHRTGNAAVSEDRRPLAICVRNLPARSSDTSLKDGLFHEYKKHGKVTWVKVVGAASDRYALVCFKKPEDVEKALEVSRDKQFFGYKIEVAPYQGYDVDDNEFRPFEAELDEYHPKATRTLFIGNLEKDVTASELRKHFEPFGEIIEIDIKKQGAVSSYAFCQYSDITSVVKAMRSMDGEHLGANRIKLGFGKSMPTTCVWVDGIGECVSEKYLNMQFHQFGPVNQVVVDRERGHALVFFEQINCAQTAVKEMRGASLRGRRLQVDFASRECQETFYEHLERQGVTGEKPWDSRPSPVTTFEVARERSFESAVTVPNSGSWFTRYETPPRARTASYSRTPGGGSTPGASPAHPTAMSRTSRRSYQADPYYDGDYPDPAPRRFRSYDEFSQGSGASHDDYESSVLGDSKLNDDDLLPPPRRHVVQSVVTSVEPPPSSMLHPPPDIRHLQKERVHLLEQLEECHSSGDEGFAPKKRPKLESSSSILCEDDEPEIASLLVTSHSGRKGMDVRRVSDSKILVHHSTRRGSCEGRGPGPCKRRRDTSSRHHEHHDGSRPGTPLVDERPENIIPSEPRRFRERSQEGPLSLPLPRFAAQMMNNNNTSNSNNNNNNNSSSSSNNSNNNNINTISNNTINNNNTSCTKSSSSGLSKVMSPPGASNLSSVPSPVPQPPASPPPRHSSPSPTSSDSEIAPQSPSFAEKIRSLDERYEKWSGSRALSAAGGDTLARLDASASEKFRLRHRLLDLDVNQLQPSDIAQSVLAKKSVFDEDSKRLENFSEKYEPKEFTGVTGVGSSSLSSNLGSSGACSSKVGLQYPFPSHPPVQQSNNTTSSTGNMVSSSILTTVATAATTTLVSPSLKTDPRTAVHNCVHPTPATPITPGTSIKTASPELPPVSLPIGLGSGTAASINSFNSSLASASNLNSNSAQALAASTARTTNIGSTSIASAVTSSTSTSSIALISTITSITTATTTIATSSSSHHQSSTSSASITSTSSILSSTITTPLVDSTRIKQRKEGSSKDSRDSRDPRHNRGKENSRKTKKDDNELEKNRKERDDKDEKSITSIESSSETEKHSREMKENKEARYERKEREERDKRDKEDRERQERRDKEDRDRQERKEREERERREKDEERREKERLDKERQEKERKEKEERERERKEREENEAREKEKREKDRIEKERKEREEKERQERREREERERKEREMRLEREKQEKERIRKEREEQEKREREERERVERERRREEKERIDRERKREKEEREKVERERRKEKEEREKQEKEKREKDEKEKLEKEKEKHEKEKRERREREDQERREKEKAEHTKRRDREEKDKEKRDRDESRRQPTENHLHLSNQTQGQASPAPVPLKRRGSSQDTPQEDESKRMKISDHRRDSKDRPKQNRRSEDRKHRNDSHRASRESRENRDSKDSSTSVQSQESRESRDASQSHTDVNKEPRDLKECRENRESRDSRESRESRDSRENRDNRDNTSGKDKQKKRNRLERSDRERERSPRVSHELDKDFLGRIELSKRTDASPPNNQGSHHRESSQRDHHHVPLNLHSDNDDGHSSNHEMQTRHPSHTDTDSDEPKKHSIFDIPDDEPAYISMYDKVKARSTKNMQKLEEEKRQVKLKDKFSQLKQSRARREEKKQSTSWDGDSVSSKALTEDEGTSESDSTRTKSLSRKGSRSRIHSDTSEEEESFNNKVHKIKTERFLESDVDLGFADTEEKHNITVSSSINNIRPVKEEPRSSDDEERVVSFPSNHPVVNNHQRDSRKKSHKKKQKRSKISVSSEEGSIKLESSDNNEHKTKNVLSSSTECRPNHVNDSTTVASATVSETSDDRMRAEKKQRNKKEKRRERTSEDKAKTRRKRLSRQEARDSQRMEDIFGPLSDDVDEAPPTAFFNRLGSLPSENNAYGSDSDVARSPILDVERVRRKTEKKRRHQAEDENSVDLAEAGREIEAKLLGLPVSPKTATGTESNDHDVFRFTDDNDSIEPSTSATVPEKVKEKKKKRKKSKEERSRKDYHHHHHHHHHHHDKSGALPYLGADPSPPRASSPLPRKTASPTLPSRETLLSPIPKNSTPISAPLPVDTISTKLEKKKDKFIPGFGIDIDEKIHENAIKSISEPEERESDRQSGIGNHEPEVSAPATPPPQVEDKPRVVISQEETEDAVAALLEETFGVSTEDFSYEGDEEEAEADGASGPQPEAPQEDVEEMQQAVESLNASTAEADADLKPDTPQSEHDLQIDTDTEEDPTYDSFDLTQPPKTPDIPSFYKSPVNKQTVPVVPEKVAQNSMTPPVSVKPPSPPPTSIITHSWPDDHKPVITAPQTEATDAEVNQEKFVGHEALTVPPSSPTPQYKQPFPCSVPIINETPRLSAASPRPSVTSAQQPLYQRLPVSPQSQMAPPLRQTPPRMPVVTTIPSSSVSGTPTTVPPLVQSRVSTLVPSQLSPRVSQPLSPNGQWSRGSTISSHLSHAVKSTTTPARIAVSVPLSIHRPEVSSQHIYSTAASQQPLIQHAPGMRALAPSYPRGGLPPLSLNIPTRLYMPVPSLVSGIPRDPSKPRDPIAFEGKSVIETLIPAHPNESPQRLDEPKLSPAVIPESTNKASTSPKVPSPNQPPTFIPETAKIEISASTSTSILAKTSSTTESVALSPRQKQQSIAESDMLSPKQKQELTNVHLLTTHPSHTSAPSPVIVAHGQHLVHKSVVHSNINLVPPTVSSPNQPLIKTVVPVVSQHVSQASQVSHEKSPIVSQAHQPSGQLSRQTPISQGILLVKSHIPLVSTVTQSSITKVSTSSVTSIPTTISTSTTQSVIEANPTDVPERFGDQKTKVEPTEDLPTPPSSKPVVTSSQPPQTFDAEKQEETSQAIDLHKTPEIETKPQEQASENIESKVKVEKFEEENTDNSTASSAPVNLSESTVVKTESQVTTETPEEVKNVDVAVKNDDEDEDTTEESVKEPSSDPLAIDNSKEDPTDSKEDSDYWSAKEVNIESVIKTVDALCDALFTGKEINYDEDEETSEDHHDTSKSEDWPDNESAEGDSKKDFSNNDDQDEGVETCEVESTRSRRARSKKGRGGRGGVASRRVNRTTTPGKRGGRTARNNKQEKNKLPADVYEFHDDSEEDNAGRPRLILTIKSPGPTVATGPNAQSTQPVAAVKEVSAEEFVSPAANTRKSKRLAEKDGSRTTVDDVIEDVVRGAANKGLLPGTHATRRSTRHNNATPKPVQQPINPVEPRKSARGARKTTRRTSETNEDSGEEKSKDVTVGRESSTEEPETNETPKVEEPKPTTHPQAIQKPTSSALEPMTLIDPVTGMLIPMRESEEGQYIPVSSASGQTQNIPRPIVETRILTVENNTIENYPQHPRPVSEEVKPPQPIQPQSLPPPPSTEVAEPSMEPADLSQPSKNQSITSQPSVITKPQPPAAPPVSSVVIQPTITSTTSTIVTTATNLVVTQTPVSTVQSKPTSLKAHVLNPSKLASTPVAQQIVVNKPMMSMPSQPTVLNIIKQPNQAHQGLRLQIPPGRVVSPSLSPRAKQQQIPPVSSSVVAAAAANGKPGQPMSPVLNSSNIPPNPKQHLLQAAKQQQQQQQQQQQPPTIVNMPQKIGINVHPSNVATTPVPRIHNPVSQATSLKGINGQPHLPNPKAHLLQALVPTIVSGGVSSPPTESHIIGSKPVISAASCSRSAVLKSQMAGMEPPKVEVSMSGCIMVPTASPGRGVPVPPFEAALHGPPGAAPSPGGQYGLVPPHRTQSPPLPPPAHHHANASQGDVVNHYGGLSRAAELPPHYIHPLQFQQYLRAQQEALTAPRIAYHVPDARSPHLPLDPKMEAGGEESHSPPLELIRATRTPHDRTTDSPQIAQVYMLHGSQRLPPPPQYNATNPALAGGPTGARGGYYDPPPAHIRSQYPMAASEAPTDRALTPDRHRKHQVATPPHASQVPPQADSLLMLLQRYPVMWQGLLALKNDQAAVQMHFVFGNPNVAQDSLPCNSDGSTPPLRIAQRMRLEQTQVDGVARKMQTDNEHCMLLALPCGRDHMDVLQQSKNLQTGFITYLQQKQAAGIVNIAAPGSQQPAYVVHIFPSCDFANESLARIAPDLLHRVAEIAHLVIVIATV